MDEWQVGDPIGLGNDAGVPDIPYMGYLNTGDDEDDDSTNQTSRPRKTIDEELADDAFNLQADGRYNDALKLIAEAIDINPRGPNNWNVKAIILDNMGLHEDALKFYDKSLEIENSDVVKANKAQCLLMIARNKKFSAKYTDALEYVNRALAVLPEGDEDRPGYLCFKGSVLSLLGREVQSRKCYLLADGLYDRISELEEQENRIKNSNFPLISVTGTRFYRGLSPFPLGVNIDLIKEPENKHDMDAIRVEIGGFTVGYVANSPYTVPEGVMSATQIKDRFTDRARAKVMFIFLDEFVIARLI